MLPLGLLGSLGVRSFPPCSGSGPSPTRHNVQCFIALDGTNNSLMVHVLQCREELMSSFYQIWKI